MTYDVSRQISDRLPDAAPEHLVDDVLVADDDFQPTVAATDAPRPPSRPIYRSAMFVAPVVGLALFFLVWEIYVRVAHIRRLVLPLPSSVLRHLIEEPSFYWHYAQTTMKEAAWGFVL